MIVESGIFKKLNLLKPKLGLNIIMMNRKLTILIVSYILLLWFGPPVYGQKPDKNTETNKVPGTLNGDEITPKHSNAKTIPFIYTSVNKRDPFRSLIKGKKEKAEKLLKKRKLEAKKLLARVPITPLQQYDLKSLKLTAVIWGDVGKYALIETPDGKGYTIKKGAYIGKNLGIIEKIEANRLLVSEKYLDSNAIIKDRQVELVLHKNKN